ncbi:hypothetical protein [Xylanibacter muris]|uniref:Phosphoenolpyruvate carboxykinase n=1 Tax=Xylanibacter muris TaxID=2736290 RepID=A0ABX2AP32_9BACT|nr:hypothetical protein [Xylanibacter muris]NPD92312.1 hypothetical protein [Xylanibacter muris]
MEETFFYSIAEFNCSITFADTTVNSIQLLPSFKSFSTDLSSSDNTTDCSTKNKTGTTHETLFRLYIDDTTAPAKEKELIRNFDTGNGDTMVFNLPDGGYQFIIKDLHGKSCALLITNSKFTECRCALKGDTSMRIFGLNSAIMLIFAYAASFHDTLLIHASCVRNNGKAFPFIAKSGTGKSTHSNLWMNYIPDTDLINDDNPIIRIINDTPYLYGSPWSGKTPCYRNVKVPLGAITRIERAPANSIEKQPVLQAMASIMPSCSSMKWDLQINNNICDTLTKLLATIPVFTLRCLPDREAAELCHRTLNAYQ